MINLPEVIEQEVVRKLKKNGEVVIKNVGRFYLTRFKKDASLVPSHKGKMVVEKNKDFTRIGFRPALIFKEKVGR